MLRLVTFFAIVCLLELTVDALLLPTEQPEAIRISEKTALTAIFGNARIQTQTTREEQDFQKLWLESGLDRELQRLLIPSHQARQRSVGFENVGDQYLLPYLASRQTVLREWVRLMIARAGWLELWLPFTLITLLPFGIDGLVLRRIGQSSFHYPSPLLYQSAGFFILVMLGLLPVTALLPLAISPVLVIAWPMVLGCLLRVVLCNLQKRL